jgi:PAS domain S-box-containing protein
MPSLHREPSLIETRLRAASRLAAGGVAALGLLVLGAWAFDIPRLRAPLADMPPMTPGTALALLWSGGALALLLPAAAGRARRFAGRALAGLVALLGALTLAEYAFEINLPIHHGLIARAPDAAFLRPAPNSAVAFVLTSAALFTIDGNGGRRWRASELLAWATSLVALAGLAGYVYGAATLHSPGALPPGVGMAAHTALGFLAIAGGILCARPDRGLMADIVSKHAGGIMARRLLAGVLAVPLFGLATMLAAGGGLMRFPAAAGLLAVAAVAAAIALVLATARSLNALDEERERAAAERRRWQRYVENASWGAAASGPEGRIELVNPAFARMHGFSVEEIVGRPVEDVVAPHRRAEVPGLMAEIEARGHVRIELEHVRKDGSVFPVVIEATATRDESGRLRSRDVIVQDMTEAKKAEEVRARLASLVESADDAIFTRTLDGTVIDWNAAAERQYGYTAAEMIGRSIDAIVPAGRLAELEALTARVRSGERVQSFETVRRRKDGSELPVALTLSPIIDAAGRVIRQKALETALRRSEAAQRELFELAPEGIFVADLDGRYTDVNGAGCRMLGFSREEIVAKSIADLIPPEDLDRLSRSRDVLLAGEIHVAEWSLRTKEGGLLPVEVSAKILPEGRWLGFVRDISGRRAAEEALRRAHETERRLRTRVEEERAWLEAVIDQLPEAVLIADRGGRVVRENLSARALAHDTGRRDARGEPLRYDLRDPAGAPVPAEEVPLERALARGEVVSGAELALVGPDGVWLPVLVSATPVVIDGARAGAVTVYRDIRVLKELERLRDEWASLVAHDLRQPVSAIMLWVNLLRKARGEAISETERRAIDAIQSAARRGRRLIDDLLDVTRIDARRMSIRTAPLDLAALVRLATDRAGEVLGGREVVLSGVDSLVLEADADRVEQVIENLLANAAKYGAAGTAIRVEVTAKGGEAEVAVTNEGPGIEPDELPLLFSRFARTRSAREGKKPGIGLGLYICRGLVEAHGGRITAESEPGRTTTFRFTLPLVRSAVPIPGGAPAAHTREGRPPRADAPA